MKVKAAPGLQCPMEGKPRQYITDADEGVEVADSAYYRRLLDDGSLLPVVESQPAPTKVKAQAAPANEGDQTDGK